MKREERRQAIMDLLVEHREVDLDDLAERFAVSKMTIHRDLDELEQAGVLRKVRGVPLRIQERSSKATSASGPARTRPRRSGWPVRRSS